MQAPCQLREKPLRARKLQRGSGIRIKGESGTACGERPFRETSRFGVQIREGIAATSPESARRKYCFRVAVSWAERRPLPKDSAVSVSPWWMQESQTPVGRLRSQTASEVYRATENRK